VGEKEFAYRLPIFLLIFLNVSRKCYKTHVLS